MQQLATTAQATRFTQSGHDTRAPVDRLGICLAGCLHGFVDALPQRVLSRLVAARLQAAAARRQSAASTGADST